MSESLQDQETIRTMQVAVEKAADIVAGPGSNPLEVFPDPSDKERRADVVWGEDLTTAEQAAFRGVMAELGPGREEDFGPNEAGLDNYVALFEGGQVHKMIAQLEVVDDPNCPKPDTFILSGSTGRSISDAEMQSAAQMLSVEPAQVANNEYGLAQQAVEMRDGFVPKEQPELVKDAQDYSLHHIGELNGIPVNLMGIHRTPIERGGYRQMSNQDKLEEVKGMIGSLGLDTEIAVITSATYEPSNTVTARKVQKDAGVGVHVLSYGTHTLARVKRVTPTETQPSIAQLGTEAFKTAKLLKDL